MILERFYFYLAQLESHPYELSLLDSNDRIVLAKGSDMRHSLDISFFLILHFAHFVTPSLLSTITTLLIMVFAFPSFTICANTVSLAGSN